MPDQLSFAEEVSLKVNATAGQKCARPDECPDAQRGLTLGELYALCAPCFTRWIVRTTKEGSHRV